MHMFLDARVNQLRGPAPVGAWQAFGGAEQPADQRSLLVHCAALWPKVYAVEFVEGRCLFGCRFARQAGHLF